MASILRSSKFVRYFSSFARSLVFNSTKETDGNFLHHSQVLTSNLTSGFATIVPKPDQNLELSLKRLDQDVRRTGRISRRDIEEVLEEIRNQRSATSSQSLLVIRCCGNLVPEELPEIRTALVQEIWKTLNNLSVAMDISHYNALLRVYLENEHPFSPTEFLAELESKGVEPNRVTFQRLISRYCQQGDIEGATRILEFMREKQLPINEHVFNALIMGHSQAEDMESSLGILSVMKQAGLEPTADTYTTLLCSYAKIGDTAAIQTTLDTCDKNEIYLLDKDLLDIIYTLATNGYANEVDPLLARIRKSSGYNQDAVNLILRLTNKGQEDVAFKILKTMPRSSRADGELTDTGTFFVKQLVKAKRPTDKVLAMCRELQESGMNAKAFIVAVEAGVTSGCVDLAMPFLRELKQSGQPVRHHYFWPVICTQGKLGDDDQLLNLVRQIHDEFQIIPNGETTRDYIIPNLQEKNIEKMISLLRTAGVSTSTAAASVVYDLLLQNRLKDAANVAISYDIYYQPGLFRRPLINALIKTDDVANYIRFVRQIYDSIPRLELLRRQQPQQQDEDILEVDGGAVDVEATQAYNNNNQTDVLGQIVLDVLINCRQNRIELVTTILKGFVDQGLSMSSKQAEKIQDRLGSEMTADISKLLAQLTAGDLEPIPVDKSGIRPSSFAQLTPEQIERLIEQQEAKGENSKGLKRFLLSASIKAKDLTKTEQLISRFEAEGYVLTSGVYAQLIDLYCHHEKLEAALENYEKMRAKEIDFVLDDLKAIHVANLLVTSGKIDEAIKFLEENTRQEREIKEERMFNFTATVWRMLNALAETGHAENLNKIYDTLERCNYIEPSSVFLGPLVKVHIVNEDLPKAVETFETICNKHKCTPWKNDLACKLIQAEDAVNLQRLTDISTNIHGEVNSLYDLVFSFVECGRIRQARKILETPGLRSRPQKINVACERYQQEGKVEPLEGLVEATRDLNHIDRGDIYYNLLLSYCKDDQPEKALGLWTKMQEEDITPTEAFLGKLGRFLLSKNLEVPFVVPQGDQSSVNPSSTPASAPRPQTSVTADQSHKSTLRKSLRFDVNDIDRAIEAKRKLTDTDRLSVTDQSYFIEALVKADRLTEATKNVQELLNHKNFPLPRIFKFYLNKISNNGDVATLNQIDGHLDAEVKKMVSFDNRLCHAYVVAGKSEPYLDILEQRLDAAKNEADLKEVADKFPRGGLIGILEGHPELLERIATLVEKYAAKNIVGPMNVLWQHYFVEGNTEIADKLWQSHVSKVPRLMFQRIIQGARERQDEALAERLLGKLKTIKVTDGALGNCYSCILDIHANKNQFDQGLAVIEEAVTFVSLTDINRTALIRIKEGIEQSNKVFPHKIPDKQIASRRNVSNTSNAANVSSSTSSSSSSSDDEPKKKQ